MGVGRGFAISGPLPCKHRIAHRKRGPGQQGLRVGANLLGRNLVGSQIAWKWWTRLYDHLSSARAHELTLPQDRRNPRVQRAGFRSQNTPSRAAPLAWRREAGSDGELSKTIQTDPGRKSLRHDCPRFAGRWETCSFALRRKPGRDGCAMSQASIGDTVRNLFAQ